MSISLDERIEIFDKLFYDLQSTNSRLDKEAIAADFIVDYPSLQEDWIYILEVLAGKHPLGYTFYAVPHSMKESPHSQDMSVKELLQYIKVPIMTEANIADKCFTFAYHGDFIEPIVNRTLRLGIGRSLLDKTALTPMLAKKFEFKPTTAPLYVTEKLDGNRCLAYFNGTEWEFTSRSGKPINAQIDMTGMPLNNIYDGELMSREQTDLSSQRTSAWKLGIHDWAMQDTDTAQQQFNKASGMINRKSGKKDLVYNIFDIVSTNHYHHRRKSLELINVTRVLSDDIRIVPVLYLGDNPENIHDIMLDFTQMGAEGIMLNMANRPYEHKRSNAVMKYKQVQNMDMMVVGTFGGKGKYEGAVGGLICQAITDDKRIITCSVGSGLSDAQRIAWRDESQIINKIVTIAYHELSQSQSTVGTKEYSLRFPRLISIRSDKNETSEY